MNDESDQERSRGIGVRAWGAHGLYAEQFLWGEILDRTRSRAVVPYMKQQRYGKIVNISSGTVFNGAPRFAHYVTSKAGVIGFTRVLARELGEYNITVNAVAPGPDPVWVLPHCNRDH